MRDHKSWRDKDPPSPEKLFDANGKREIGWNYFGKNDLERVRFWLEITLYI